MLAITVSVLSDASMSPAAINTRSSSSNATGIFLDQNEWICSSTSSTSGSENHGRISTVPATASGVERVHAARRLACQLDYTGPKSQPRDERCARANSGGSAEKRHALGAGTETREPCGSTRRHQRAGGARSGTATGTTARAKTGTAFLTAPGPEDIRGRTRHQILKRKFAQRPEKYRPFGNAHAKR